VVWLRSEVPAAPTAPGRDPGLGAERMGWDLCWLVCTCVTLLTALSVSGLVIDPNDDSKLAMSRQVE
jgi:hypothetical protein